jgi:hypothetical protein
MVGFSNPSITGENCCDIRDISILL